jgi:ArsR family transcriptional regulator
MNLPQEIVQLHADLCHAMADPRRILLIYALAERPFIVSDLAKELEISQPSTSRHLKVLRECGLVQSTRTGASIEYRLTDRRLVDALNMLRDVLRDRLAYRASLLEASHLAD